MKKLRGMWKGYFLRPVLYKCVTKCAIALALVLLWNRFANGSGLRSAFRDGGFIAAAVLLGAAWVSYLRLDGVDIPRQKKEKKHRRSMADFADEHIISWDELSEEERHLCGILSSLISAALFLLPALFLTARSAGNV